MASVEIINALEVCRGLTVRLYFKSVVPGQVGTNLKDAYIEGVLRSDRVGTSINRAWFLETSGSNGVYVNADQVAFIRVSRADFNGTGTWTHLS